MTNWDGTFAAGGDPSGVFSDFNAYYFFATAGSTIDVSLERVDTSKPWEHPDSLDPEIAIAVPDGFIPQNLVAWDTQPGVDLNASLHGAVLPLSGMYVLYAQTTRGFGDYRLHFAITSMAQASERVYPFTDNFATVPVGETTTPIAIMLDPRGYRISGAQVSFATTPSADDLGTVEFSGGSSVLTGPDGSAQTTVTAKTIGKVTFAPAFVDSFATSLEPGNAPADISVVGAGLAPAREAARPIPRYQSVARQPFAVTGLFADGSISLSTGPYERLPVERRHVRKEVRETGQRVQGSGVSLAQPSQGFTADRASQLVDQSSLSPLERTGGGDIRSLSPRERVGVRAQTVSSAPRASLLTDPDYEPLDASTAVPLPEPPVERVASAMGITSCDQLTFVHGIVPAGTVLHPPFTVTLTDLTPSTGKTEPNGEVGVDGIHGHRIEKTVNLKLDVKDATGAEPTYPVLVQLALVGPRMGRLILDRNGSSIECSRASFLWHERDAQGALTDLNDTFAYRLGTLSLYVGVAPDPNTPGQVTPVWGTAELLSLSAQAKAKINDAWSDPFLMAYGAHPEPGKPDHFASFDFQGRPEDNRFEYWSDYLVNPVGGGVTAADRHTTWNVYALVDAFGNTTYGYGVTSASSSAPNVMVEFKDQLADGPDFAAYTMTTWWNAAGGMPEGDVPASLSVTYPGDPDWAGGTATQPITLVFQRGTFHAVMFYPSYDHYSLLSGGTYGPWDEPVPLSVGPGDSEGVLPKTTAGDTPRFTLLLVTGTNIPNPMGAPWSDPHNLNWSCGGGVCTHGVGTGYDPRLEVTDPGEFRLSLMDGTGNVAKDAQFRVHLCPRYDHEGPVPPVEGYSRTCTMAPQVSENGVVESVIPNPQGSTDGRGYIGIELIKAPFNPGSYLIYVESKDKAYRIREQSHWFRDFSPDGVYSGGWWLCTVRGAKLLNENFEPVTKTLNIAINRGVYAQEMDPNETQDSYQADIVFQDVDTEYESSLNNVRFWRLGRTTVFQTGLITVISPDEPESPAGVLWNASVMQQTMPSLQNAPPGGTLAPTTGRKEVFERKTSAGGKTVTTKIQIATSKLPWITKATPNFDGVTHRFDDEFGWRDGIRARVRSNAKGLAELRLVNVDSDRTYTFDFYTGNWGMKALTTDLRGIGGIWIGTHEFSAPEQEWTFGEPNPFIPKLPQGLPLNGYTPGGTGYLVAPGLYLLRVTWAKTEQQLAKPGGDPLCSTDVETPAVCKNEWVVSVGQRILLDLAPGAETNLQANLTSVRDGRTPGNFLSDVAEEVTRKYTEASGNVVVATSPDLPRPYLRHIVRDSLTTPDHNIPWGNYATSDVNYEERGPSFPLQNPDRDLAQGDDKYGISRDLLYKAPFIWKYEGDKVIIAEHLPERDSNKPPNNACGEQFNPCAKEVLFNRYVNVVAHETAHGFGIITTKAYASHGDPTGQARMVGACGEYSLVGLRYEEFPLCGSDAVHESYNHPGGSPNYGQWVMEWGIFHWAGKNPGMGGFYDDAGPSASPQDWLMFDRPLRFSLSSDFVNYPDQGDPLHLPLEDRSVQRFLSERVPLCGQLDPEGHLVAPTKECR